MPLANARVGTLVVYLKKQTTFHRELLHTGAGLGARRDATSPQGADRPRWDTDKSVRYWGSRCTDRCLQAAFHVKWKRVRWVCIPTRKHPGAPELGERDDGTL